MTDYYGTNRWRGVIAVTLGAAALGLLSENATLLLLGGVGVVFAAYPLVTPKPDPHLELGRRLSEAAPRHGDEVEVTVTVRNAGAWPLFDVRFLDGVPDALSVTDGRARRGLFLRPGAEKTFTYTVAVRRGKHVFEPATVVVRDLSGARETELDVSAETEIDCMADLGDVPLRSQTMESVGRVLANDGGAGVEFYQTREYQQGDPLNRIDWNHVARTGEATTVDFRREQAATVVVLVDARESAYRGVDGEPHAVTLGVSTAERLFVALLNGNNKVGLAGIGRSLCWVAPASGRDHRIHAQDVLATHEAFRAMPPSETPAVDEQVEAVRSRLGDTAQVIVVSPLTDDDIVDAVQSLDAYGHAVTVVNPVVTADETLGQRLAEVERRNRVSALRSADIPLAEWQPDRPLSVALASAREVRQ